MITFLLLVCLMLTGYIAADYATEHRKMGLYWVGCLAMSSGIGGLLYMAVWALLLS